MNIIFDKLYPLCKMTSIRSIPINDIEMFLDANNISISDNEEINYDEAFKLLKK